MKRRRLLLAGLGALTAACVKPPERPTPTPPAPAPEFDAWNREARGMLSDALNALRTFDSFMAYRLTSTPDGPRSPFDLDWDPPTSAEWNEATHVAQGLRARADQLLQNVSSARIDPNLWREQRALADGAHSLLDLGDALAAYRARVDSLPPGNAGSITGLLDRAWTTWTDSAARWNLSRSESIGCAS